MRSLACVAVLFLTGALPALAQRSTGSPALDSARYEAMHLLQGLARTAVLPEARIQRVMRALATIREQIPEVRGIHGRTTRPALVIYPPGDADRQFVLSSGAINPGPPAGLWAAPVPRLGIPALDRLNAELAVDSVVVWVTGWAVLRFHYPPNLPVLARRYTALPMVGFARAGPAMDMGSAHGIELVEDGPVLNLVFIRGSGDCPAGCMRRTYYQVSYDTRTGSVTQHAERPR